MGDFNISACMWEQSGYLSLLDMVPITAGSLGTCRTSTGTSQLDYLLVDAELVPLIGDMEIVANVPWGPHTGVRLLC